MEKIEANGYILEKEDGKIVSITSNMGSGSTIRLGQIVTSNGRFLPKKITGPVVEIKRPFSRGHTNDIIMVKFQEDALPHSMKFKDLELDPN